MKFLTTALIAAAIFSAAPAHATGDCPGTEVMGVPISDGSLPIKCFPAGQLPPGYADGTGGNALGGIGR
jgi:hypothetical protein